MPLGFWSRRVSAPLMVMTTATAMVLSGSASRAEPMEAAVLQGLDKVTARISTIEAPVGQPVRFGTLEIVARHCDKTPPEEQPEAAAFLQISEIKRGEPTKGLFIGWMFASSPALSSLEHPVYDVVVVDCVNRSRTPADRSPAAKPQ